MKNRLVTIDSTKRTLTISTSGLEDKGYQLINGSDIILVDSLGNSVYELKLRNGLIALPIDLTTLSNAEYNSGDAQSSLQFLSDVGGIMNKPPPKEEPIGGSPSEDAFGRLRVSEPLTVFNSKQIFDNQPLFWDDQEVSGSGTGSSYSKVDARTQISVGATTAGKRVRRTFQRFNYQPGKSQLILLTGNFNGGASGITKTIGYGDDDNGIFFQSIDDVLSFSVRKDGSQTPVTQDNWNIDKMDGTGLSGITFDDTTTFIYVAEMEWLGVGRVRVGFNIDGVTYYVHQFLHANNLTSVYISTPNLPVTYEIENDGTGVASTLDHICSSVVSEGGVRNNGILFHKDSGSISSLSTGTTYAVLGIRLKSANVGMTVLLEAISMISTTQNEQLNWQLIFNPTVAGTFTYSGITNSAIEVATGAASNTVTNGLEIDGGYLSTSFPVTNTAPSDLRLGAAIDGTVDEIILAVRPITNNVTIEGSLTWRELQ
jgi:hypothetical protein